MRVKLTLALALIAAVVGASVSAQTYSVYKTKNTITAYDSTKAASTKPAKVNIETYTVFQINTVSGYIGNQVDPVRVVTAKKNKEYERLINDQAVTDGEANPIKNPKFKLGKKASKVCIDPRYIYGTSVSDVTTEGEDEYAGDPSIETELLFAGDWEFLDIPEAPIQDYLFIQSYNSVDLDPGAAFDLSAGLGEVYSGKVKVKEVKTLKGSFSSYLKVVSGTTVAERIFMDQKGNLKLDKKTTALAANEGSMKAAVAAVVEYLVSKKYASTWTGSWE